MVWLLLFPKEDNEELTTFVWPFVVFLPKLKADGFPGSGPLYPLSTGGAYGTKLTLVLCVAFPLP